MKNIVECLKYDLGVHVSPQHFTSLQLYLSQNNTKYNETLTIQHIYILKEKLYI